MKKWTLIFISSLLVLLVLATACSSGGNTANQQPTAAPNTDSPNDEVKKAEPVKIKFYSHEKADPNEPFQKAINAFNGMQTEIQVENVSLVQNANIQEYIEKLDVLMATGEQVDGLFFTQDHLQSHAALGVLEPLDDYFGKHNLKASEEYFMNPTHNGKQYGMMLVASPWLVMFNEDHLKESGLPLPDFGWTWEDFSKYAKALTKGEGENKRYGTFFPTWGEYANPITFTDNPHPFFTEDMELQYSDESFKYWFELRRALEEDKSVVPHSDILATNPNIWAAYFTQKASMFFTGSFGLKYTLHNDTFPHTFKTVYAPLPKSSKDAEEGLTIMSGDYLAIAANSKNKEATFTFIRWLTTEGSIYIPKQSAWKKGDGVENVKRLVGDNNTDVVDIDSLVHVLFDPRVKTPSSSKISVPYSGQLKKVLEDGFTKFSLDKISAEDAQQFMMTEGKKITDQHK
ncbi:MAG TPA: extracellular solute-binding protein [Bacilli bacterium]